MRFKHRNLLFALLILTVFIYGWVITSSEPKNTMASDAIKIGNAIECLYTFIYNDIDVTEYDSTNHLLKTRIINNGVTDTFLGSYQVWYENVSTPSTWNISNPENYNILKNSSRIIKPLAQ